MNGGLGLSGATKRVADHARSLVRLELQLAGAEVKRRLAALGLGIALTAAAALFALMHEEVEEEILPQKSRWYQRLAWWLYGRKR